MKIAAYGGLRVGYWCDCVGVCRLLKYLFYAFLKVSLWSCLVGGTIYTVLHIIGDMHFVMNHAEWGFGDFNWSTKIIVLISLVCLLIALCCAGLFCAFFIITAICELAYILLSKINTQTNWPFIKHKIRSKICPVVKLRNAK